MDAMDTYPEPVVDATERVGDARPSKSIVERCACSSEFHMARGQQQRSAHCVLPCILNPALRILEDPVPLRADGLGTSSLQAPRLFCPPPHQTPATQRGSAAARFAEESLIAVFRFFFPSTSVLVQSLQQESNWGFSVCTNL